MGKRGRTGELEMKAAGKLSVIEPKQAARPLPVPGMNRRARELWKRIVASLPAEHFRPGDLPLLRAYCEADALHAKAAREIGKDGGVIKTGTGSLKASPWIAVQTAQAHTMSTLATKLRLATNARITGKGAGKEDESKPASSKRSGLMFNA